MSSTLNKDGQPLVIGFNNNRNKEKALQALRGILEGVTADRKLNETELLFLDVWLKADNDYKQDGDFLDLSDMLQDILEDGVIEKHELIEIQEFLSDVLHYGYQGSDDIDALTNQLLGFLQGITSDDNINDTEILKLKSLLESNEHIISCWPGNTIYSRLKQILADGVIDDDERKELLAMLKAICGQQFIDTGSAECSSTDYFSSNISLQNINGKCICFTGKFFAGTRKIMESLAQSNGAEIRSGITRDLDYLIIGSLASRDWKFTSHGRKIEAVIKNQNNGYPSQIINEEAWVKFVESSL